MALNTIGNMTYINQASSATSALQANNMPHQAPINHALFHEQMQKVEEARPAEELHKTDDREGNGKREFDEQEKQNKRQQDFQEQMENAVSTAKKKRDERIITEDEMLMRPEIHLLDVKG